MRPDAARLEAQAQPPSRASRLVRSALRSVAARAYWASPHFLRHLTGKVLILAYHRVIPRSELASTFVQPGMYVTPDTFDRHLRFLSANFALLSLHDLLAKWRDGTLDPTTRHCVLTFDDGWRDNVLHAYPLLRAYRAPATIFLPTELIGTGKWLWSDRLGYLLHRHRARRMERTLRETLAPLAQRYPGIETVHRQEDGGLDALVEAAKTLPEQIREDLLDRLRHGLGEELPRDRRFLDWREASEMSGHGITFGSHTCSHAALIRLGRDELRRELQQSLEMLRSECVNHVPVLSYPYGEYTEDVLIEARTAGYEAAVTTEPGVESRQPGDLYRLRRVGVHDDVSPSVPLLALHIARHGYLTARTA